jgi:hypothetical protein
MTLYNSGNNSFLSSLMDDGRDNGPRIAHAYATKQDLDSLIHSKEHFVQLFTVQGRFLLPPKPFITWRFIREVLNGTKELLPLSKVPSLYMPPKVSELTVKTLYDQVKEDIRITRFFPETNRPQDKLYFFAVLSAILPDFYETILAKLKDQRKEDTPREEKITVTPMMQELIGKNIPYLGEHKKVGHFVTTGRKWGTPVRKERPPIDLRQLF